MILNKHLELGILDWGQTKTLTDDQRLGFARLIDAMSRRHGPSVATAMVELGIRVEAVAPSKKALRKRKKQIAMQKSLIAATLSSSPATAAPALSDPLSIDLPTSPAGALSIWEKMAYTMFDTADVAGLSSNPFSDQSALRSATVKDLPPDLFFVLRTVQILRGICAATGNSDYSIADAWAPAARKALRVARR
jgi:hypothetical protein